MAEHLILILTLIGVLGIGAQWVAWRFNLPAIVLMSVVGLLVGPGFGWIAPEQDFGDFFRPMIAIAVAVILFEGGLSLKYEEFKEEQASIFRLVFPGAPIGWALGALAAHYLGGLSWPSAILFAGIMVVTGPTVIMPLLRQSRLSSRPATLLKWEGIINDPIGALLAVVVFEFIVLKVGDHGFGNAQMLLSLMIGAVLSIGFGILVGAFVASAFRRGFVPEYLKSPVLLAMVLVCFVVANLLQEEAGLLSVTAMGVTLANAKLPSINDLRHFKENIAVLFVSGVFVMLTANLDRQTLAAFDAQTAMFVGAMLFVVRPAAIFISTLGTSLSVGERILIAWIAPRGIVAVAVTSFFAVALSDPAYGISDAREMIPLAFAMVFATVVLHGFTIGPLARMLKLSAGEETGVLIVGASPFAMALAEKLKDMGIKVIIADDNFRRITRAKQAGIDTYYGEILSEVTEHHIDLHSFGYLLAIGENDAHNALVCTDLAPEMGRTQSYQLRDQDHPPGGRRSLSFAISGQPFPHTALGLTELVKRCYQGWVFQATKLSAEYSPQSYLENLPDAAEIIMIERRDQLLFANANTPITPQNDDKVLAFVPPKVL